MAADAKVIINTARYQDYQFGQYGFKELSSASSAGDTFYAFKAIGGDATVSAVSGSGDNLTSVTVQQGDVVYGNFTSITPSSGTVLAYLKASNS